VNIDDRTVVWSGSPALATVWDAFLAEPLFTTDSRVYSLNDDLQPLVVGRKGNHRFING